MTKTGADSMSVWLIISCVSASEQLATGAGVRGSHRASGCERVCELVCEHKAWLHSPRSGWPPQRGEEGECYSDRMHASQSVEMTPGARR